MTYIKQSLHDILDSLASRRIDNPIIYGKRPSKEWVKINWLYDLVQYLLFSVNALDEITTKFNELKEKDYVESTRYLPDKFIEIIYHSRNFFELVFILFDVLNNSYGLSKENLFNKFQEVKYVNNLRNIFIVHPDELGISFSSGIPVVIADGEILMLRITGSYYSDDESRKRYFNDLYSNPPQDISRKYLEARDKIKLDILDLKNTHKYLQESPIIESIQLHGVPQVNQKQFADEILNLFANVILKS